MSKQLFESFKLRSTSFNTRLMAAFSAPAGLGAAALTIATSMLLVSTPAHSAPPSVNSGGIDGGGGGTLPVEHVFPYHIRNIVKDAKRDLRLLVKYEMWGFQGDQSPSPVEKKLYGGKVTMLDILNKTDLELEMEKPCYDAKKNEVDASIHASKPGAICLSAFRIAPKLIEERARVETLALILHELSHLLGLSEEEARKYQWDMAYFLKRTDEKTGEAMMTNLISEWETIPGRLERLVEKIPEMTPQQIGEEMSSVIVKLNSFMGGAIELPFAAYDRSEMDFLGVQADRFMYALWYAKSQSGERDSQYWKAQLDKVFAGQDRATIGEAEQRHFEHESDNRYKDEVVKRVQSNEDLRAQLRELAEFFRDQGSYIYALRYNSALPLLPGPWRVTKTNPWQQFLGTYEIVDRRCEQEGYRPEAFSHLTGITIHYPDYAPTRLYIRELNRNGWGDVAAFDNGGDVLAGAAVTVSGRANMAERRAEFGDRWDENYFQLKVTRLTRTASGFTMFMGVSSKANYSEGRGDQYARCRFEMKKVN